ncbi:MAG TPA: hypothetical protein VFU44_11130 [Candidatus Limnocylindria bacterium]|nr:hypothetical protein [Candidatus Limnocylindria bacterium]
MPELPDRESDWSQVLHQLRHPLGGGLCRLRHAPRGGREILCREDDAERSVRAALELVDVVRRLGPAMQARAGVLTGEAAVTIGATNQEWWPATW